MRLLAVGIVYTGSAASNSQAMTLLLVGDRTGPGPDALQKVTRPLKALRPSSRFRAAALSFVKVRAPIPHLSRSCRAMTRLSDFRSLVLVELKLRNLNDFNSLGRPTQLFFRARKSINDINDLASFSPFRIVRSDAEASNTLTTWKYSQILSELAPKC